MRLPLLGQIHLVDLLVPACIASAKAIGRAFDVAESIVGFVNAFEFACWIVANDRAHKTPSPPATARNAKASGPVAIPGFSGSRGRGGPSIVDDVAAEADAFAMTVEAWRSTIGSN